MSTKDHLMDNAEADSQRGSQLPELLADEAHEQRIKWWREAKVGLFIHWGLYSLPGGVWKGDPVNAAYAEHLQLRAQIPIHEYERIADQFHAHQFDASAWVRAAKDAGLKYMIFTAKHHEGFAMYDSQVSDYTIVKATPFGRDPVAELADACKRENMVLCLYYSHAMDWHHPDSQGNTLDFPANISAYDPLHAWVEDDNKRTRYEQYLQEKAFPQVKELLTQYGPIGILWFDCGHKITDEQGKQFVDLVHETQPNCLVNRRVRREGFGDYENTGDNQRHISAQKRDWESIATLNHSWGYNQTDHAWRSPEEVLHDMIHVVSMGGNYVINVGPTGDGNFDAKSLELLGVIGNWLELNGESIYASQGSPIGRTPWGRCTRKGSTLYLHVWDWPAHGELLLPGIRNSIQDCYLLADTAKTTLSHRLLNDCGDHLIELQTEAPDSMCIVVAVEFDGELDVNPRQVLFAGGVTNVFGVFDGELYGEALRYDTGKKGRDNVKNWSSRQDYMQWKFRVMDAGAYKVTAVYGADEASAGGSFEIAVGQDKLVAAVTNTGGEYQFQSSEIGLFHFHAPGEYVITVQPNTICGNVLMNLKEITLTSHEFI
ncbi:alpha-L-fucosidase [Paenibacillus sp. 2RAB27]|uniref:alpha-L-fucosidase n=1 Tax=Paenibacillus sp. 2RAB27 TaxID=3232991 RepID=UPI003F97A22A